MNFETALQHILRHEGGLVNNPKDPGGITKCGISLKAYPALGAAGIRNLTPQQISDIYRKDYWDASHCDQLPASLRLMMLDCSVNQGVGFAATALQSTVGVRADGAIGPGTIAAAARVDSKSAVAKFAFLRFLRYVRNPNWNTFRDGWMQRLFDVTVNTLE